MNSPTRTLSYSELGKALNELKLGIGASDLHGSMSGYLCAGGQATPADVLGALALESDDAHADDAAHQLLAEMVRRCQELLEDPQMGFEPLLPDATHSLAERAEALVQWCRGFIGGLGLAGLGTERALSDDAQEILHDLGTIAGSHLAHGESEEDEVAFTEVLEFVRVAVMLLHTELQAEADDTGPEAGSGSGSGSGPASGPSSGRLLGTSD